MLKICHIASQRFDIATHHQAPLSKRIPVGGSEMETEPIILEFVHLPALHCDGWERWRGIFSSFDELWQLFVQRMKFGDQL